MLISRPIGEAFIKSGYYTTIGETYGASQRGGAVSSHVRISKTTQCGDITPMGEAHLILGLLPLRREQMKEQISLSFKSERLALNMRAFETGLAQISKAQLQR